MTSAPAVTVSLPWFSTTEFQTVLWPPAAELMAIFMFLPATCWLEPEKEAASSWPRWVQRPCSTQKAAMGTLPELGART